MSKIIVTGGAGFIASHICQKLLDKGHTIFCVDNLDPYYDVIIKEKNLEQLGQSPDFHFFKNDIRDASFLMALFAEHQFDYLFHAAARAGVRPSLEQPALYADVNILGSINLLECLKQYPATNSVFLSSSSVYGNYPEAPFKESFPDLKPISPYAASKLAMEGFIHSYHHSYKIPVNVIRPFTIYGPGQRPEMAIHYFSELICKGEAIPQFGDGTTERDYTYIDDFCQGALNALFTPLGLEIFNLGESDTISLNDLISLIEKHLGKKAIRKIHPMQKGDVRRTFASIEKAKKLIGYQPEIKIQNGIELFSKWFLESSHHNSE